MTKASGGYRLVLVPVGADGTIPASFLEEAKGTAPLVSKERPIDLTMARALLLSSLEVMENVRKQLLNLAEVLPQSTDRAAMFDDRMPCDESSFMVGALEYAAGETLPSLDERLRRAATVTNDELRKDFFERHARYLAEQERRLRQGRS